MYHDIVPGTPQEIHSVSVTQFAAQMRWLQDAGYQVTTVEAWFAAWTTGKPVPRKTVAITFDDGFQDNHTVAWPILQRHGFPATIFVVTGAIAKSSTWRDTVPVSVPMLTTEQIIEMAEWGICFGSHTVTHRRLTELDSEAIDRELIDSKKALENLLQRRVTSFSYPYSAVNPEIKSRVRAAGYQLALTYEPYCVGGPGRDALQLRRIGVLATDTIENFARKVRGDFSLWTHWHWRRTKRALRNALAKADPR